tara:strand:- start:90 stop:506 length:417 start_codon:yes stop_codon:yes gene_type:complete
MIYKIEKKLKSLEIDLPLDTNVFHSAFVNEFNNFLELKKDENNVELLKQKDIELIKLFDDLHDIEEDEPEVPKPTIPDPKVEKENQILDILKNKRNYSYKDLKALGIDVNEVGYKFRFKGYVFQKRTFTKEYTIVQKP